MANQWMITEDKINTPKVEESRKSTGFKTGKQLPVRFRLLDDDREVYFMGRMEEEDFHPLDDFGMPGYGCTIIETSVNGKPFEIL
jgi:hypothetical protein